MWTAFSKLKIRTKLGIIFVLSVGGLVVSLGLFYQGLKASFVEEQKQQAQHMSQAGISLLNHYLALSETSVLSEDDAQRKALMVLESISFGSSGYFWVNSAKGQVLMHPYVQEIVNESVVDEPDARGVFLHKEFISVAQSGGGFVEYYWPKPHTTKYFPKMSYIEYFAPWGWVVGTGVYIDEMEQQIHDYAKKAIGIVLLFTLLLTIASLFLIRSLVHQLNISAIRDPLTLLYTRRYLSESEPDLIKRSQRHQQMYLSIIYMDIDHFKRINDNYGHDKGDQVIAFVGETISSLSRPEDVCVRYGGEEFLVVTMSEHEHSAQRLVERIRNQVSLKRFKHGDTCFSITLSAGIAVHNKSDLLKTTITRADAHLYEAKLGGRNAVVCDA